MRTEPFETKNHSGLTIRGELFIPEGEGPFPTVVFFHGFTGTYKEGRNEEILRLLARSGVLGIGFDFTNEIVSSSDGSFFNLTLDSELDDANSVLNFAMQHKLVDEVRVGIAGHSLGGLTTLATASKRKDLKTIALISTVWNPLDELPIILEVIVPEWEADGYIDLSVFEQGLDKKYRLGFQFYKSFEKYDPVEAAKHISVPTLVVHGKKDEVVSSASSNKCYNNLKVKDKKLVLFDNANHTYSDPKDQAKLIKLLADWFKDKLSVSI